MKLSIYLIKQNFSDKLFKLKEDKSIKSKEIQFENEKTKNNINGLILYQEKTYSQKWLNQINKFIDKENFFDINPYNLYRVALILNIENNIFVISFNNGINLINSSYIDYKFGFNTAREMIDSNNIFKYESLNISSEILNIKKRSNKNIPVYKINDMREIQIIESITGKEINNKKKKWTKISGKNNLLIDFKVDPNPIQIIEYLTNISKLYLNPKKYKKNNYCFENLNTKENKDSKEKFDNELIKSLKIIIKNYKKNKKLNFSDIYYFKFNINEYNDYEYDDFKGFNISGLGLSSNNLIENLSIIYFFERFSKYILDKNKLDDDKYIMDKLKRDKISLIFENGKKISKNIYNCFIFELPNIKNYDYRTVLISGRWYSINKNYYKFVYSSLENYENKIENLNFIDFKNNHKSKNGNLSEAEYNVELSKSNKDLILFDQIFYYPKKKQFNKISITRSKIEPCDVLKYDENKNELYLIHIKRKNGASNTSHIATQVETSTNLILNESTKREFIEFLNAKLKENTKNDKKQIPTDIPVEKINIVFGFITKKYNNSLKNIFSLLEAQSLSRVINDLKYKGIKIHILKIKDKS